jgi:hypothetical protein
MHAHDIGSQLAAVNAITIAPTSSTGITTGSTGSMGFPVDRRAMASDFNSAKLVVSLFSRQVSTSGSGYCTVTLNVEDGASSESTSFSAYTTAVSYSVGCTSQAAAGNYQEIVSQDVNLAGAGRWLRALVTVARPATSSYDLIQAEGVWIFGGASILPATT